MRGLGIIKTRTTRDGLVRHTALVPNGSGGYKSMGTTDDLAEAQRWLSAGAAVRAERASLARSLRDYGESWLDKLPDRNIRTWRSTWSTTVCAAPFVDFQIDAIERSHVRDWARALLEHVSPATGRPISWQTAKHALNLVRRCLAEALEDGLIAENPAAGVKLSKRKSGDVQWDYLRAHEIDRLLADPALPAKQRSAFAFAIMAGTREGEQCALDWERLDISSKTPHAVVSESWDDGTTKTNRARIVPILPALLPYLLEWWRACGKPTTGPVWPSKRDGARHKRGYDFGWADTRDNKLGVCWLGWRRRAGIGRRVTFHSLRHTCGSHLAMGTFGVRWEGPMVRDFLGHTDERTTQRYVHIAQEALHEMAARTRTGRELDSKSLERENRPNLRAIRGSNPGPSAPEATAQICKTRGERARVQSVSSAQIVLGRVAAGKAVTRRVMLALARAVRREREQLLARRIEADDPLALQYAIELAGMVLDKEAKRAREQAS